MSTSPRRALGDDLAVEAHEARQVRRDAVQVVGREHDRQAVGVEVAEQVQDLVAGPHVDARRGLVEEQEVGPAEQRPGEEHALLLAAGELADVPVPEPADPQPLEHGGDLGALRRGSATAAARPRGPRHEHALARR